MLILMSQCPPLYYFSYLDSASSNRLSLVKAKGPGKNAPRGRRLTICCLRPAVIKYRLSQTFAFLCGYQTNSYAFLGFPFFNHLLPYGKPTAEDPQSKGQGLFVLFRIQRTPSPVLGNPPLFFLSLCFQLFGQTTPQKESPLFYSISWQKSREWASIIRCLGTKREICQKDRIRVLYSTGEGMGFGTLKP